MSKQQRAAAFDQSLLRREYPNDDIRHGNATNRTNPRCGDGNRDERGPRRHDRVTQAGRESITVARCTASWVRLAAGGYEQPERPQPAKRGSKHEARSLRLDGEERLAERKPRAASVQPT